MIRIDRPQQAPAALAAGAAEITKMNKILAANLATAGHPPKTFSFDSGIYGHRSVKDALWRAQHDKCAYCEGSFRAFGYGDVEHYRPKGYSQQTKGGKKIYPGYYWLAYRWENLLVSCELCNRARKRNLFPLVDASKRARDEGGIQNEEPLLIDPAGAVNPRDHIRFVGAAPEGKTPTGKASIEAYYLDRPQLTGERYKRLRQVVVLNDLLRYAKIKSAEGNIDAELADLSKEAQAQLDEFVQPTADFSAMTLDFFDQCE